jgi:predicted 3-demethylubiquinone-9 3-methyltransferase (glyoxalase superfamily)
MPELFKDQDSAKAQRARDALLRMKKLNIAELEQTAGVESAGRS